MAATLREVSRVIRSKNAGPFIFTFDIMFRDAATFAAVREAGHLDRATVARAYGLSPNEVLSFEWHGFANAVKFSIRREVASGGVGDSDVYGAQQHAPLLELQAL
ncbi:MAG: DUF4387 domain-containing protein [Acetobacteraceae bacterium]|nr:DUF4387 domain-containing protein [Acetobacteraceae bacterium]